MDEAQEKVGSKALAVIAAARPAAEARRDADFFSQMLAGRQQWRARMELATRCYARGASMAVRRLPPGYRTSRLV